MKPTSVLNPGWVYAFRTMAYTARGTPVFKVGVSNRENPNDRTDEQGGPNRVVERLACTYHPRPWILEKHVLNGLKKSDSKIIWLSQMGREYFTAPSVDIFVPEVWKLFYTCPISPAPYRRRSARIAEKIRKEALNERPEDIFLL